MSSQEKAGHRQRLRERFLAGEPDARTNTALLELLLTYAIPQQDVRPLAERLVTGFGGLDGVLEADPAALCRIAGVKTNTAVLLKLIHWLRNGRDGADAEVVDERHQPSLFDPAPVSGASQGDEAPAPRDVLAP